MVGLRASEVRTTAEMSHPLSIVPSHILHTVAVTIVHSITVAGAALDFHQLPSLIYPLGRGVLYECPGELSSKGQIKVTEKILAQLPGDIRW